MTTRGALLVVTGLLLTIAGCGTTPRDDAQQRFAAAEAAAMKAQTPQEFLQVAGAWQALIDDGVRSAAVFYNQGNAFMQAGQPGRAIACYRLALRYRPLDARIRRALEAALVQTGGQSRQPDWFRRLVFWHDWIGYAQKFRLTTGLLLLTVCTLLASRVLGGRRGSKLALGLAVLSGISLVSVMYDWHEFEHQRCGVVIVPETTPRTGAGPTWDPAINGTLHEGAEFTVVEQRGDWIRANVPGTGAVWLPADDVTIY